MTQAVGVFSYKVKCVPKVPYNIVRLEDAKIFNNLNLSVTSISDAMSSHYEWLRMCGWSKKDYDEETLRRIDVEWLAIHTKQLG